nr:MAG TPA: hypothetical protein [Caudoviricetes sp.]
MPIHLSSVLANASCAQNSNTFKVMLCPKLAAFLSYWYFLLLYSGLSSQNVLALCAINLFNRSVDLPM